MLYTFIDIETTGYLKYTMCDDGIKRLADSSEILEVGFLIVESVSKEIVNHGVLYFYKPYFQIESEAQNTHHITRDFLKQYEGDFEKNLVALNALMQNAYIVGKNSKKFDIPYINAFLYKHAPHLDIELLSMRLDMKAYNGGSVIYNNKIRDLDIQLVYADRFRRLYKEKFSVMIGNSSQKISEITDKIMASDFLTDKQTTLDKALEMHEYYLQNGLQAIDYYFDDPNHKALKPKALGSLTQYVEVMPNGQLYVDSVYSSLEKVRETGAHGALYDAVATYIIWLDAIINKII